MEAEMQKDNVGIFGVIAGSMHKWMFGGTHLAEDPGNSQARSKNTRLTLG